MGKIETAKRFPALSSGSAAHLLVFSVINFYRVYCSFSSTSHTECTGSILRWTLKFHFILYFELYISNDVGFCRWNSTRAHNFLWQTCAQILKIICAKIQLFLLYITWKEGTYFFFRTERAERSIFPENWDCDEIQKKLLYGLVKWTISKEREDWNKLAFLLKVSLPWRRSTHIRSRCSKSAAKNIVQSHCGCRKLRSPYTEIHA